MSKRKPWDMLTWRRLFIDKRTPLIDQPLVSYLDGIELKIFSGVMAGGPGHRLELVAPGGRHFSIGMEKLLCNSRRRIYYGALALRDELAMLPGVPAPAALASYSHHIWAARSPNISPDELDLDAMSDVIAARTGQIEVALAMQISVQRHAGRFARSPNGTLRFSTDQRDYYEHRDRLDLWTFAPLSADRGGVVPGWADGART